MTPKCLKAQYGVPDGTLSHEGNELALFETLDDEWDQEDLDIFYKQMQLNIPKGFGPKQINLDGAQGPAPNATGAGDESTLDVNVVIPVIYPQRPIVYQIKWLVPTGDNANGIFDYFMDAFSGPFCKDNGHEGSVKDCNEQAVPHVLSISWGGEENPSLVAFHKVSQPVPLSLAATLFHIRYELTDAYFQHQCTEWMKFGLAGSSVFFASGDDGTQETADCYGPNKDIFTPDGPSSCPYITAVGSTYLPPGSKVGDTEKVTAEFGPGGGFSNIFPTPDWQAKAVGEYLSKHAPSYKSYNTTDGKIPTKGGEGIYNRGGRGFPDIAANGWNIYSVEGGEGDAVGGTSASAPLVASMFNLINEERIKAGKGPVGFINPALYQLYEKGGAFTDITQGDMSGSSNCGRRDSRPHRDGTRRLVSARQSTRRCTISLCS